MGGSSWSNDLYNDRAAHKASTGTATFDHDDDIKKGRKTAKAHDKMSPHGVKIRESRDSETHPDSVAIGVFFDVTGSMGHVPVVLQQKLPKLMELLLTKGYCKDPQILVGAVGDYHADRVALQTGQFESGIEIDEQLGLLYLEGGGGGSYEESYQNAMYFFARHTAIDCWEKRGKKGFLFLIGDEKPYAVSTRAEIKAIFDDDIQDNVSVKDLIREVSERYNVFFIIPSGTEHFKDPALRECWAGLLGAEHVIMLEDPSLVCETIGSIVGMFESGLSLDKISTDLGKDAIVVKGALDKLMGSASLAKTAKGNLPATAKKDKTVRL